MASYWDSVCWNDVSVSNQGMHEAGLLKLNCDKALFDLEWQPTLEFEDTVRMTAEWYKAHYEYKADSMREFSVSQIEEYTAIAKKKKAVWVEK
jgi:CDP-glucose 4,6-dehydratase